MTKETSITGIALKLVGEDSNAYAIMGRASRELSRNGRADLIDQFLAECKSGDYNHLLVTCMKYFDCD